MSAAAALALEGRRVLVLERHVVPGGFTHTFQRGDWRWDVGVHAVGRLDGWEGALLDHLAQRRLRWADMGPIPDRFHFPWGLVEVPRGLEALAAGEPRLLAWGAAIEALAEETWRHFGLRLRGVRGGGDPRTTRQLLDELGLDERQRALVTGRWAYLGEVPERSAAAAHALMASSFLEGSHYPVGGAASIARALLRTVAERGGACVVGQPVQELLVEGGRCRGVRLRGRELRAEQVLSGLGARTVGLLPEAWRRRPWARGLDALPRSVAHVALHLGFDRPIEPLGADRSNHWLHNRWPARSATWDPSTEARPQASYLSFPSLKDPEHRGSPTATVVAFVPADHFGRRGLAYREAKREVRDRLLGELAERFPELRGAVVHAELGTPRSTTRFLGAPEAYGLAAVPERYAEPHLRPETGLRGLVLAGADLVLGSVIGALAAGALAAGAVLGGDWLGRWAPR